MVRMIFALLLVFSLEANSKETSIGIITQDQTSLRAAPRSTAQQHALLWQGEAVEVRGEKMDYLQVYDYQRERRGFVRANQVRRLNLAPEQAPELLSVVRFLQNTAGSEALGIAYAAAYIQAAPAELLTGPDGIAALDAIGTMADRLARRASTDAAKAKTVAAHLEVATRHGLHFTSNERSGRIYVCYDGEAFRRVLALPSTPEQRARAVLGLTRSECMPGDLQPSERRRMDEWRVQVLDQVDTDGLPAWLRNRVVLRRASTWAGLAYQRARAGDKPEAAATRALLEMSRVNKGELSEEDGPVYSDAAMRVNASRWALASGSSELKRVNLTASKSETGETCLLLADDKGRPLTRRCTYGLVWTNSATLNREGTALAVAVQQTDAWREMWIFYKAASGWTVRALPPAATQPEVGYAEFAGWVPGGSQVLVAREATSEGRYRKNFELVRLDTLGTVRQVPDPSMMGAFQRWQDPAWKRQTLSVR